MHRVVSCLCVVCRCVRASSTSSDSGYGTHKKSIPNREAFQLQRIFTFFPHHRAIRRYQHHGEDRPDCNHFNQFHIAVRRFRMRIFRRQYQPASTSSVFHFQGWYRRRIAEWWRWFLAVQSQGISGKPDDIIWWETVEHCICSELLSQDVIQPYSTRVQHNPGNANAFRRLKRIHRMTSLADRECYEAKGNQSHPLKKCCNFRRWWIFCEFADTWCW